jgi:lipid II:glycine glycyltransferase (peptidoglycan interpeptide bridge formation enzyme)
MKEQREFDLGLGFTCCVDAADENEWNDIIQMFRDATVNQTWAYCQVMSKKTSHLIIRRSTVVVAAAMVRLIVLPVLKAGIAYIGAGPMWRLRGEADDFDVLRNLARALRAEYVARRGLFLRVSPNMFTNLPNYNEIRSVFIEEGFDSKDRNEATLFLDLEHSLEELRTNFDRKWRACLVKAEQNNLNIREGTDDELFNKLRGIYEEMLARKQYATEVDIDKYETIQRALPESLKPRILLCESDSRPMAGVVISTIGETAIPCLLASNSEGRKCYAAYLIQWELLKMLKKRGIRTYDLGGCRPKVVPETYHFKAGICGKRPQLFTRVGIMDACDNPISYFAVRSGELVKFLRSRIRG